MSATSKRSGGGSQFGAEVIVVWCVVIAAAVGVGTVTASVRLGALLDGSTTSLPANPFELTIQVATGAIAWPRSAMIVAIALGVLVVLLAVLGGVLYARRQRRRTRVDRAAVKMGRGRDIAPLTRRAATATAQRLGVQRIGLTIGRAVAGGATLYQGWEDVSIDVWGPRAGKTTSRAIPAILEAPGVVLATSNKRDLVDATRGPRSAQGDVWVFDPQGIVGEDPAWWWNPLSFVTNEVRAEILADIFASASRDPGARTDAYFEPAGQQLLANLLLAAALAGRSITQVYLWLSNPTDDEPVGVLEAHDYPLLAAALQAVVNAPEKQRGGVYGTATQIASFLTNRQAMQWVTPDAARALSPTRTSSASTPANPWLSAGAARRAEFVPDDFVRSGAGTIYSLSKEGRGNAGPLVTALTVAITEAAEDLAKTSPGGRLRTPMVAVLDEAANVCRWRELPNVYSHYGSRGICILTILQSWSQGVDVWGREGMRKLWSAANIKVYGGGVSEKEFLDELSQLIGDFDLFTNSVNFGRGQRSSTRSTRRERVLDVADLTALPRGRIIVFASGARATLARSLPWMDSDHADAVRASIRRFDPGRRAHDRDRRRGPPRRRPRRRRSHERRRRHDHVTRHPGAPRRARRRTPDVEQPRRRRGAARLPAVGARRRAGVRRAAEPWRGRRVADARMSGDDGVLGEWADTPGPPAGTPSPSAAKGSVDLGAGLQDAMAIVVARRLQRIATEALDEVLDEPAVEEPAVEELRDAALTAAGRALGPPTSGEPELPEPPELYFSTLPQFVEQLLVPLYRRSLGANTLTWCAEWWRHPWTLSSSSLTAAIVSART